MEKPAKYNAKPTTIDGHSFDSQAEAYRYSELKIMHDAGAIVIHEIHPRFVIVDAALIGGKQHRARYYVADFMYFDKAFDQMIVEDIKGVRTAVYTLKRELFLRRYPHYDFREIEP